MSCFTPTSATGGSTRAGYSMSQRLVNRLKNTNPEKFCSLVQMHLSFLLDLSGSSLEEFLASEEQETEQRSVSKLLFASFGKKRCHKDRDSKPISGIFGQTLRQEAIEAIFPLIDFLKRPECLAEEGLFRKSGQAVRQRHLQDILNSGNQTSQVEEDLQGGVYTAHDCASVIKMFLRELPEPLLMSRHYIAYTQIPGMNSQSKQMQTLQLLIQLLPPENAFLLKVLLDLLHRVAMEPSNKMTADTLATLFAPHLLVPRTTNANDLQSESCNVRAVVAFMISHPAEMFEYPVNLVRDIQLYWEDMDGGFMDLNKTNTSRDGLSSDDDLDSASCPRFRKRVDPLDRTLNTSVCFVNRQSSDHNPTDFTNKQIAELYAYVSDMPDSPMKRRFIKQFNKVSHGTPCDIKSRRNASSLTGSIRKMMGKTPAKRKNSYDLAQQCSIPMSDCTYTPRVKVACYTDLETTPLKGNPSGGVSLRQQIQQSIPVQCSKLPLGSSHSSLSSTSSSESCDTCSIHSNTSTTHPTSPSTSCCRESMMCGCVVSETEGNTPSMRKCMSQCYSAQMLNALTQDLPHLCYDQTVIEEDNKENNPGLLDCPESNAFLKSSKDSFNDSACDCEPMDVSMEIVQSPSASDSVIRTPTQPASLARTPTLATPTCIRA